MNKNQPTLLQALGLGTAILLVAGNMIGSGVFKKIAPMSAGLMNQTLILLAWVVAGAISMLGAFCFASLATTTKEAGGQFQYFKSAFGDFVGFMYGWSFFTVISTASIASMAYVFAESVVSLFNFPTLFKEYESISFVNTIFPAQNATVKIIAIFTLISLTIFNIRGVKGGGILNNVVTLAKITGICFLIILGLTFEGHATLTPSLNQGVEFSALLKMSAFFTAMLGAFWAFDGWVNVTNMASEIKNPTKNVPLAIIIGTALTTLLYVAVNYAYLQVLTPYDFANLAVEHGKIAAVKVAEVAIGGFGIIAVSSLIMISTFGSTQGSIMSAARVYYQMAKEGYFFKPFAKVHAKYKTPYMSLTGQAFWAGILIISGTFDQLTDMLIFVAFIFYALGATAVIILKKRGEITLTFAYPFIPIAFLICSSVIVINAVYSRPLESLTGLALMALGVPAYYYFARKNRATYAN